MPFGAQPFGAGDVLFKDRIFGAAAVIGVGNEFGGDLAEAGIGVGGVVAHQLAHYHFPGFEFFFVPFGVPLARFGAEERILDAYHRDQ